MASLRRPSQFFGKKDDFSVPRPRAPRVGDTGRKRDVRQSKVEEKMKTRRMSMRYAGPPDFGGSGDGYQDPYQFTLDVAPPIMEEDEYAEEPESNAGQTVSPARPMTTFQRSSPVKTPIRLQDDDDDDLHEADEVRDEQIRTRRPTVTQEWDFEELAKDGFDLQAYVRKTLQGADEQEKKRLVTALQKQKEANAKELRTTVFKNYAEFITVSKEITTLENDMLELKELLTEWKTVPQLMGMDDTLAPTLTKDGIVERHRSKRNSPRDLQQMFRTQLTNLWTTVEGSQKFLPQVPGRRLVFETHGFIELNSATYKAKQNVSLFLLNDLLLVAGRRRMKAGSSANGDKDNARMVAERCWVLADLVIVDLKDTGDLTNALKVKRGKEVFVYRASKAEEKKALLAAFRQVSQDLADKRRKESEAEQERRRTMWHGEANARMTRMSLFMTGDQGSARPLSTIGTSLADTKDLLWIDEFADDLTMAIATQDWDLGVVLVERGQDLLRTVSNNAEATEMLQFRLDTLRPTVIEKIAHDLSSPDIRKSSAARLIALLTRLDRAELARDTFLKARHDLMVRLVRSIKHEGDISLYINELSVVCFTVLRHTSDWYINAFKDNRMASGFVSWAKEQIEYFGDVFRRQVYAPAIDARTVAECLRVTGSANRKLLRDIGLDFTFLIEALTAAPSTAPTNRQTAHGFRPEMANFVPSIPSPVIPSPSSAGGRSLASPSPASPDPERGPTAPLSIPRRPSRGDAGAGLAPTPPSAMRSASSTSVNSSASSGGRSPGNVPRPPPRSERRSRPPPAI